MFFHGAWAAAFNSNVAVGRGPPANNKRERAEMVLLSQGSLCKDAVASWSCRCVAKAR